ncbi:MAG: hypothetical protein IPO27_02175 [Bacteroidetes bacterium]|nr:hypothetical protein [Bacteroidota bacterium]
MKKVIKSLSILVLAIASALALQAQEGTAKSKIAVISIDYKNEKLSPQLLGTYVRNELGKVTELEVMDRYDMEYILKQKNMTIDNCYGKICLCEAGTALDVTKMLSGFIDDYGQTIILTLNLVDVKSQTIEKTSVKEYLNLPDEMANIIKLSVNDMFSQPNDAEMVRQLTRKFNQESYINNPQEETLGLDGPRFGAVYIGGEAGKVLSAPRNKGGFDGYPYMFQFGYQLEKQYLTQGRLQALFEFLPMISGLDQGLFIPSLTILHGVRDYRHGIEFAFGPSIRMARKAEGYYDAANEWQLKGEYVPDSFGVANPYALQTRLDSRGTPVLEGGFIFAVGLTLKSGKLNIPLNAYAMPYKEGLRIGVSFGFNAKKKQRNNKSNRDLNYYLK